MKKGHHFFRNTVYIVAFFFTLLVFRKFLKLNAKRFSKSTIMCQTDRIPHLTYLIIIINSKHAWLVMPGCLVKQVTSRNDYVIL